MSTTTITAEDMRALNTRIGSMTLEGCAYATRYAMDVAITCAWDRSMPCDVTYLARHDAGQGFARAVYSLSSITMGRGWTPVANPACVARAWCESIARHDASCREHNERYAMERASA